MGLPLWGRYRGPVVSSLGAMGLVLATIASTEAQQSSEVEFQRGFFLQVHENDLEGAAAAYQKVVANEEAPEGIRGEAARRLAEVNEDRATSDLAQIMPPEAVAYVEISDVGAHAEQLVQLLNLHPVDGAVPAANGGTPLGDGLYLPERVTISPALFHELKNVRGVAVAITGITPDGIPQGVAVMHPGDSSILRGIVETAIQVLEPVESVGGFPTYTFEHQVWIVQTARMLVVGSSQQEVASAVARMQGDATSLAETGAFAEVSGGREDATLFAWLSGPRVVEQLRGVLHGEEAVIATAVLDLDHVDSLTIAVGPTEHGLQARTELRLKEGHHNLAYGLIRTAPLSRRTLEYVPSGIAGLALIGLNPPSERTPTAGDATSQYPAAMDLGRELFSNIEELGFFVLPRADASPSEIPLPEMALVVAVKDAAKSQALWNQLLILPTFAFPQLPAPNDVTVAGHSGKEFRYPDAPPILLVRVGDDGLVVGTRGAVMAAVEAGASSGGIATDAGFEPLLAKLSPSSSKALLVDVGRALETAASAMPPRDAQEMRMVAGFVGSLRVSLVTDEQPTSFAVRLEAANLPDAQRLIDLAAHSLSAPPAPSIGVQESRAAIAR